MLYGVAEFKFNLMDLDDNAGQVFSTFQEYVGKRRHALISKVIESDKFNELPPEQTGQDSIKAQILKELLEKGLQIGKAEFMRDYNDLAEKNGWRKFDDKDIVRILERQLSSRNKMFPSPADAQRNIPEF